MDTVTNCTEDLLLNPDPSPVVYTRQTKRQARRTSADAHATADALGLLREWAKVFTLTATQCACCGKDLRDSVSVTQGIGPECSRQHYEVAFDITDEMVMAALGRLAASNLDHRVKVAVRDLKDRPRDLCNVLIWWSSVNLNKSEVVLECAEVVTLLGFVGLGDRLRERNTNVVVSKDDSGDYTLRCKAKVNVLRNMRRVKEAVSLNREGRFKYGWKVPANRKELMWTILGEDFGNEWATVPAKDGGPSRVVKVEAKTAWDVRRAFEATYNPPKPVVLTVVAPVAPPPAPQAPAPLNIVVMTTSGIEVYTPSRNWQFVADLKILPYQERRWNPEHSCWKVALKHEARVRELVAQHFNGAL